MMAWLSWVWSAMAAFELRTRPGADDELYRARFESLPPHVRTPSQLLGVATLGCEGTAGVFPACNLSCKPCYHSRDANEVRVDGPHTLRSLEQQMALLQRLHGDGVHCQLIGGEVSLLSAADHAAALQTMLKAGRIPMSFTNGEFTIDYLRQVAQLGGLRSLRMACHFDRFMYGRAAIPRPKSEAELNPLRASFCDMFEQLRRERVIDSFFLAHNMTVTGGNVAELAEVIRSCRGQGWRLFSFQPAALVGDEARWSRAGRVASDQVWAEIERGAGTRLPYRVFQMGDERCNRTCWGFYCGADFYPLLDETHTDLWIRDAYLKTIGRVQFTNPSVPWYIPVVQALRGAATRPLLSVWVVVVFLWRLVCRIGLWKLLTVRKHPMTFVMHSFMDATVVAEAHALNGQDAVSADEIIREAQERLQACSYLFASVENDSLVPGCVQHSVLDPEINKKLRALLPKDLEW